MRQNELKFNKGQHVRHKLARDVNIMMVVEYERRTGIIRLGVIGGNNPQSPIEYTGQVLCSWMDENNSRKTAYFYEHELESIEENMSFSQFHTDTISLTNKSTGEVTEDIRASVQSSRNTIFVHGKDVIFAPGDLISRRLSNGGEETYLVVNPAFYEGRGGLPTRYEISVRRLGIPEADKLKGDVNTYNINFNGDNSRFNSNSVDKSTNTVQMHAAVDQQLETLRNEIEKLKISVVDKQDLLELLEALEDHIHSEKPKMSVIKTIIGTLSTRGAEMASIGSVILQLIQPASAAG